MSLVIGRARHGRCGPARVWRHPARGRNSDDHRRWKTRRARRRCRAVHRPLLSRLATLLTVASQDTRRGQCPKSHRIAAARSHSRVEAWHRFGETERRYGIGAELRHEEDVDDGEQSPIRVQRVSGRGPHHPKARSVAQSTDASDASDASEASEASEATDASAPRQLATYATGVSPGVANFQ
jgi:hypothetical protein